MWCQAVCRENEIDDKPAGDNHDEESNKFFLAELALVDLEETTFMINIYFAKGINARGPQFVWIFCWWFCWRKGDGIDVAFSLWTFKMGKHDDWLFYLSLGQTDAPLILFLLKFCEHLVEKKCMPYLLDKEKGDTACETDCDCTHVTTCSGKYCNKCTGYCEGMCHRQHARMKCLGMVPH